VKLKILGLKFSKVKTYIKRTNYRRTIIDKNEDGRI
jgi:hypothetical protein